MKIKKSITTKYESDEFIIEIDYWGDCHIRKRIKPGSIRIESYEIQELKNILWEATATD